MHTGYTQEPTTEQRIRNLAAQVSKRDILQAAAKSNGCPHEFERILTGYARAAIARQQWEAEIEAQAADAADLLATQEAARF